MLSSGFNITLITTTAKTALTDSPASNFPTGAAVSARLVGTTTNATLIIYNGYNTTVAAKEVARLYVGVKGVDQLNFPVRCAKGVTVKLSSNTAFGHVGLM